MGTRDYKYYRPATFTIEVEIGAEAGADEIGVVSLNDRPFVIEMITHQIVKDGTDPERPVQDGLYRINWSIGERTRFFTGPVPMADAAFGSVRHGIWIPLSSPLELLGTAKINVAVQNVWERPAPFTVHVEFHGVEKVGADNPFGVRPDVDEAD